MRLYMSGINQYDYFINMGLSKVPGDKAWCLWDMGMTKMSDFVGELMRMRSVQIRGQDEVSNFDVLCNWPAHGLCK